MGGNRAEQSWGPTQAGYFHEGMLLKEQPVDYYYRTTADRYRKLLSETTTPRLTKVSW